MKKLMFFLLLILLLALNWAALHDILKGEPDVWLEWSVVISSALLAFGFVVWKVLQAKRV